MKIRARLCGVAVAVMAMLHCPTSNAMQITLAWDPPLFNTDGSVITNLCGFKVHYGTTSRTYDHVVDLTSVPQATIDDIQAGRRYYFAVSACNTEDGESALSQELTWDAPPDSTPGAGLSIEAASMQNEGSAKFTLSWQAQAGRSYQIEMSSDLKSWEPAPSGAESSEQSVQSALTDTVLAYRDATAGNVQRRFYRVRLLN